MNFELLAATVELPPTTVNHLQGIKNVISTHTHSNRVGRPSPVEVDLPGGLGGNLELGFSIKLQDASFVSKLHTACTFASVTSEVESEDDDDATLEELALPFFICLIVST